MRKGWYNKAKKKWIRKNVYAWSYECSGFGEPEVIAKNGVVRLRIYTLSSDREEQLARKIYGLGWVDGFVAARRMGLKDIGSFLYCKKENFDIDIGERP